MLWTRVQTPGAERNGVPIDWFGGSSTSMHCLALRIRRCISASPTLARFPPHPSGSRCASSACMKADVVIPEPKVTRFLCDSVSREGTLSFFPASCHHHTCSLRRTEPKRPCVFVSTPPSFATVISPHTPHLPIASHDPFASVQGHVIPLTETLGKRAYSLLPLLPTNYTAKSLVCTSGVAHAC